MCERKPHKYKENNQWEAKGRKITGTHIIIIKIDLKIIEMIELAEFKNRYYYKYSPSVKDDSGRKHEHD